MQRSCSDALWQGQAGKKHNDEGDAWQKKRRRRLILPQRGMR